MERDEGVVYEAFPLETLLSILQTHQQTCVLQAMAPEGALSGVGKRLGKGTRLGGLEITLRIVEGWVQTCLMCAAQNKEVLLEGEAALTCLLHDETLSWQVCPLPVSFPAPPPITRYPRSRVLGSWNGESLPLPLVRFEEIPLASLSHRQRQALLLVNGQRRIRDLSQMLGCSPSHLLPILQELEYFHLITLAGLPSEAARP
jgi:hypothetical protein